MLHGELLPHTSGDKKCSECSQQRTSRGWPPPSGPINTNAWRLNIPPSKARSQPYLRRPRRCCGTAAALSLASPEAENHCYKDKTSVCSETRGRRRNSASSSAARKQEVSVPIGGGTHSKAAAKTSSLPLSVWMQYCIFYTLGRVSGRLKTSSGTHNYYE